MPSDLQVSNIKDQANANSAITIGSNGQITVNQNNPTLTLHATGDSNSTNTTFPKGHVIQVETTWVNARNETADTTASGTGGDVGLNVTITPKKSGSFFYILCSIGIGHCTSGSWGIILSRNGTRIGNGTKVSNREGVFMRGAENWNGDSNHSWGLTGHFIDQYSGSTAGSAIAYKCGLVCQSGYARINRSQNNSDTALVFGSYTASSVTVMEIAQ